MTIAGWLTLAVLAVVVIASASDRVDPTFALGGGVGILLLAGVLSPERALAGFANPAVLIIGLLFILVGALERSPWLRWFSGLLFGDGRERLGLRGLAPVALLSAFLSNATVIAVLMPAVRSWGRRHRRGISTLMMPLGFAATLGGLLTLIGTASNLVVNGLLIQHGDAGLGLFEIAAVGLPVVVVGVLYLAVAGPHLLPDHQDPLGELDANPREYLGWLRVAPNGPLAGQTIGSLRHLKDLYLAGVERDGRLHGPAEPTELLMGGDVLAFVGRVDRIAELAAEAGLQPVDEGGDGAWGTADGFHLAEVVVSPSSPVVGRNIRETGFRGRYDAVVLAVHRHGEHLRQKIGDIVVRPGDTLLVAAGSSFLERWRYARDFYLVSTLGRVPTAVTRWDWLEPAVLAAVVGAVALGLLPLLAAVVLGVLLLVALGRLRPADVWAAVHWPTLVMIAASIGMGHALADSGLAATVVRVLLHSPSHLGSAVLITAVLLVTALLTEVLDNPAAAALVFPVAATVATHGGVSLHGAAVAVAVGASTSFLTPFGYHGNVMISGAGGYRVRDFVRFGLPLKLLVLATAALLIPLIW